MYIWVVHGGHLEGWFLHTHTWMDASNLWGGIIGANPRTREALAFMSTGVSGQVAARQNE